MNDLTIGGALCDKLWLQDFGVLYVRLFQVLSFGRFELQGPKEEVLDENEWWDRLEKLKVATDQQEVVIKRNFGRQGAEVLEDFAFRLGLHL